MQSPENTRICDTYNSYCANAQSDYFEGSVVKISASSVASKKPGHDGIEDGVSTISKTIQGEISESKSTSSSKSQARLNCISDEQLYSDRHSIKSVLPKDSVSAADAGCFEDRNVVNNLISWDKIWQEVMLETGMDFFQVVGKGTKFMNSINLPTVIVKFLKRDLDKSMVYYVIGESEKEGNRWKVPALMFSNPYAHKKTRYAELLPLCFTKCSRSVCLAPMLRRKRYRRVFRRGSFFKVKTIQRGRAFDSSRENSWNMYDIRYKVMRNVLRDFIELDIGQWSLHLSNKPLKRRTKRCKCFRKCVCGQTVERSPGILNHEEKETTLETADQKRSIFGMNNEMPEVGCRGEYIFSKNLKGVYPTEQMGKKIRNSTSNSFSTSFTELDELDKCCSISEII